MVQTDLRSTEHVEVTTRPRGRPALAPRPLVFAQLGGCNLSQIVDYMPDVTTGPVIIRSATASLVSPPLPTSSFSFPACPLRSKFIVGDFKKEFTRTLFTSEWDVLMIDLLRDFYTGAAEVDGTYVTEFNHYVHGERMTLDAVLKNPFEIIGWQHPRFRDVWTASIRKLYDEYLKPALDQGRRIVMAELFPGFAEYRENEPDIAPFDDGSWRVYSFVLNYMYEYFTSLDPRIVRLGIEKEYWIGAFDAKHGAFDFHKIDDYYARGAELLCGHLGIPPEKSQAALSAARLKSTRERYENHGRLRQAQDERRKALEAELELARAERDALSGAADVGAIAQERLECLLNEHAALLLAYADREADAATAAGLAEKLEDAIAARDAAETGMRAAASEIVALRDQLEQNATDRAALAQETQQLNLDLAAVVAGKAALAAEALSLREALGEASINFSALEAQRTRAALDLEEAAKVNAGLVEDIGHLRWALGDAEQSRDALAGDIVHLRWALGEATTGQAAYAAELATLRETLGQLTLERETGRQIEQGLRKAAVSHEAQRSAMQAQIAAMTASRSWRITAPLRAFNARWRRWRG